MRRAAPPHQTTPGGPDHATPGAVRRIPPDARPGSRQGSRPLGTGALSPPSPATRYFFFASPSESEDSTAMKASCGTSTLPTIFIRFLPSFCFSSSFRLREMSPP